MSKAWIALTLAPAVLMTGCSSEPEPVSTVPPPSYSTQEPVTTLEPVTIDQGPATTGGTNVAEPAGYEPEPIATPPQQNTYTVQRGDTLWSIAQRTYGNGQRWRDIAQANPSVDPQKLAIGQQIILP